MISTSGVTLSYGQRVLFKDVSIKFLPGNTYGLIGANGAGKSTFLKILSGELEADFGSVSVGSGQRVAVLKQNQFEFDDVEVLKTVLMGNRPLFDIVQEKDALYAKPDFSEEDGIRASELESQFADLGGWDAESQAAEMLNELGISTKDQSKLMKELDAGLKVRVLLAQALFGNPDILLLDEPTNNLDLKAIFWLEEFLCEFKNTVIVVSHDRAFLDKVATHMADIDFGKITIYSGNYSFWYQSSQLALQQRHDRNKKAEDKVKELKAFIERFSANASKSKQATSRKKSLAKINLEEIKPSNRKYPHIVFHQDREAGKDLLSINGLQGVDKTGVEHFRNLDLIVSKGEKIAFVGEDTKAATYLFEILEGISDPTAGEFSWGVTTAQSFFPKEHENFFTGDLPIMEWLRQFAKTNEEGEEEFLRGFLGKMLFTGEEVYKKTSVLSGGEKVRCMLAKMMMQKPNVLILNEPTNHLDIESITALNNGLREFPGTILFISLDRQTVDNISTRTVGLSTSGLVDHQINYTESVEVPVYK